MCTNEMILKMQNLHQQNRGVFAKKPSIARVFDEIKSCQFESIIKKDRVKWQDISNGYKHILNVENH